MSDDRWNILGDPGNGEPPCVLFFLCICGVYSNFSVAINSGCEYSFAPIASYISLS